MDISIKDVVAAVEVAERHPTIAWIIVALLITFGTPRIGPKDKPWIEPRLGIAHVGLKWLEAYVHRTYVFNDFKEEIASFREENKKLGSRMGEAEKVISWQTQVLMAISSALKIDVLELLRQSNADGALSVRTTVSKHTVADDAGDQAENEREVSGGKG